jgi:hypothetical protein
MPIQYRALRPVGWHGRNDTITRVVAMLNDYYREIGDAEVWEEEVPALRESIRYHARILATLSRDLPIRMTANYDSLRVQSSPSTEPHLRTIMGQAAEYRELAEVMRELEDRAEQFALAAQAARAKWWRMSAAIACLSPLQQSILDGRHRWGKRLTDMALDMHYSASGIAKAYCRALWFLADRLRNASGGDCT